jgi:hypothetical protein
MLYHYTVLRTLSHAACDLGHFTGALRTHEICRQAAQSILTLAASTEPVHDLERRVSGEAPGRIISSLISAGEAFLFSRIGVVER